MKHCETCRWWEPDYGLEGKRWGECVVFLRRESLPFLVIEGYETDVHTSNDFGCILHKERDETLRDV